jgi:peptidoglycan hydrolase-like protein with peptidoglycan-binding domain
MFRSLALASTVLAASLTTSALSAQVSAPPSKPPATASQAPTVHAKTDSASTAAMKKSAATTTRHAAWTTEQIKEAQEGLAKAGFYKGKATGQLNADTRKALRDYQKKNKLPVTGRLSDDVINKLKSA